MAKYAVSVLASGSTMGLGDTYVRRVFIYLTLITLFGDR